MTTLPAVVRIVDLPAATTITGAELFEAVQTSGGVGLSVQVPLTAVMTTALGALPTGGGTSQILAKSSGSNFVGTWYDVTNFVSVNTASSLATSGTGTALVIGVATGGITSTQIANNAVGTNQLASSLGIASSLSVGTILTVGGTATFNGTAIFNGTSIFNGTPVFSTPVTFANGLNVTGTTLITGTFGVVGTSQFTGLFNVVGTTLVTGLLGVAGTTNITGILSQVGTATFTGGTFGVNATAAFTGVFGVAGTALFTSGAFGIVGTTLVTGRFGIVGTSLITGVFGVVGTTLFTSGAFGVVATTQFTGTFGVAGTTIITGTLGLSSLTAGIIVASSTGALSNQGGMVLLNTLSPSGVASTNDTTSFTSAYRTYMFVIENICPATNTVGLIMTVATSGSNFTTAGYLSFCDSGLTGGQYSTTAFLITQSGVTGSVSSSTLYGVNGVVYFHNPSSSVTRKALNGLINYMAASATLGTTTLAYAHPNGFFDGNSNPVTGVNFLFSAGNIATGVIKIYGIT